MRYFGVLSSVVLYIVLLILQPLLNCYFLFNAGSLELNLVGILIVSLSFYFLAMPNYKKKPVLTRAIYLFTTILILLFSLSFLDDLNKRTSDPPSLPKDDWSAVVIIPMVFSIAVIWVWILIGERIGSPG